jgi:uncharacterized protein
MSIIYRALCIGALVAYARIPVEAQDRAIGDWHGALATPGGRLTLFVRIRGDSGGGHSGDLESLNQTTGQKLQLAKVDVSANRLAFSIPSIGATFEGEWKEVEQTWSGVFRQGMTLPLVLARGAPPPTAIVEGLDGTWRASLQRNAATLRLILHVKTTPSGTFVRLDSPDMGARALEVQRFERVGDSVRFHVPAGQVEFAGTLRLGLRELQGTWSRPGQPDAQVTFARDTTAAIARVRTQWPIVAKGYRAEEVSFANPADRRVTLAGTMTIPDGPGPFPAVVLISGSGAQDRDESIFGHKPFAVLADHLSRARIAVLRYDDRGFGASTGDYGRATSADLATDANAAVRYLLSRTDVDHKAIGFIGHSEGGMIGPIAAVDNDRVAFLVLLAGPGTGTDQVVLSQRRLMGLSQGVSSEQLDRSEPTIRSILHTVRTAPDSQEAVARLRPLLTSEALQALGASDAQRDLVASQYAGAWMRYFLKYQPSAFLSRLRVPVLAINGSLDRQVASAENLAAMRVALAKNPDATVRELPGLNHFFQTAGTGAIGEYDSITETFAPGAMDLVTNWILQRFGTRRCEPSSRKCQ